MTRIIPTRTPQPRRRLSLPVLAIGALLAHTSTTFAATPPDLTCQKGRYTAAAKYAACEQKLLAKLFGGADQDAKFEAAISKCHVKYTATWAKLRTKASSSGVLCDNDRYDTSVAGTVIDRLTGLQWELKHNLDGVQNLADPHDADNLYSLSAGFELTDGTAYTSLLPALNGAPCFAGQCDWRVPTIYELQTILLEQFPCTTSPCIDPVFGPTAATGDYWSATTFADDFTTAWYVYFPDGSVDGFDSGYASAIRAVRGGL